MKIFLLFKKSIRENKFEIRVKCILSIWRDISWNYILVFNQGQLCNEIFMEKLQIFVFFLMEWFFGFYWLNELIVILDFVILLVFGFVYYGMNLFFIMF